MSLYYVYARYQTTAPSDNNRFLLTCASRDHANRYYRHFQQRMRFTRVSAQFWTFDPIDGISAFNMQSTLDDATLPADIRHGVMVSYMPEPLTTTGWVQAPVQAGRDWLSGRTYFIRNARQQDVYWYHPGHGDDRVLASRWQKTKFFVRLSDAAESETGTVLVRSDRVRLTTASGEGKGMVVRRGDEGRVVVVRPSAAELATAVGDFTFGELEGAFGTEWECAEGVEGAGAGAGAGAPTGAGVPCECVTWGNRAEMYLDDWELC